MIRFGEIADIPRVAEIGARLHAESSFKDLDYSHEKVEAMCHTLHAAGFFVVAVKDDAVVGAMLGDVYRPWYSNDLVGIDYSLYIEPEHRNGLMAVKMIKRFEDWCTMMGAVQIRPGISTGNPNATRLYQALGFKPVGEIFCKTMT